MATRKLTFAKAKRPKPAMNVTPLVDVVLVLLIIFMIVIPAMEHNAQVELPNILHTDEEPEGGTDPVTVSLTPDGRLFLEDAEVPEAELLVQLEAIHTSAPRRRVILRADRTMDYGEVRTVFAHVRSIGFPGVSLRVGERTAAVATAPSGEGS
jgi:biopolymer transport protein TolR